MYLPMIIFRAIAATGLIMALAQHVHLAWWEGGVLSFGIMIFFGNNDLNRRD